MSREQRRDVLRQIMREEPRAAALVMALRESARGQQYPWSFLASEDLKLLHVKDEEEAIETVLERVRWPWARSSEDFAKAQDRACANLLRAVKRWIQSGRMLVHVSQKSAETLASVDMARIKVGDEPVRWHHLPWPSSKLYGQGIMFEWEGMNAVTFAAAYGDFAEERAEIVHWGFDSEDGWATYFAFDFLVPRERLNALEVELLSRYVPQPGDEGFESTKALLPLAPAYMALNALAAMQSEHEIPTWKQRRKDLRKPRRWEVPSINHIDLDVSGLITWKNRVIMEGDPKLDGEEWPGTGVIEAKKRDYPLDRKPPEEHPVQEHKHGRWVREKSLLPGETWDAEKEDEFGKLYLVKRTTERHWRGGDGGGLKARLHRMRVGADDLYTGPKGRRD